MIQPNGATLLHGDCRAVLIDLNEEYIAMARERTAQQGLML